MIANELAYGKGFKGTILYNVEGYRNSPDHEKCVWHESRNLPSNDPEANWAIMRATAEMSSRCEKPLYHFSIDWHESEEGQLSQETACRAADEVLERMDLSEHQAMVFFHSDTDHPHVHVVVNRVHPGTGRANDPWQSKRRLEQATAEVAHDMDFMVVPGRHNALGLKHEYGQRPARGEAMRAGRENDMPLSPWSKAEARFVRDDIRHHFHEAEGWQDLSARLAGHGLELRAKGQGLIVTNGAQFAKLSDMGKKIRLAALERAFSQSWDDFAQDAGTTKRVSRLIRAHRDVERFDGLYSQAKHAGERLRDLNRRSRRASWSLTKAQETVAYHEEQLKSMLGTNYRNPVGARRQIEKLAAGMSDVDLVRPKGAKGFSWLDALLGKNRASFGNIRTEIFAKKANRDRLIRFLEWRVLDRFLKLRAAERRLIDRRMEAALYRSRSHSAQAVYEQARGRVGNSRQRSIMRHSLQVERADALMAITPDDIQQSVFRSGQTKAMSSLLGDKFSKAAGRRKQAQRQPELTPEHTARPAGSTSSEHVSEMDPDALKRARRAEWEKSVEDNDASRHKARNLEAELDPEVRKRARQTEWEKPMEGKDKASQWAGKRASERDPEAVKRARWAEWEKSVEDNKKTRRQSQDKEHQHEVEQEHEWDDGWER